MSLLDYFDSPNAQLGLGLLAAAAPRSDGAGFGQRLMEGVQSGQSMRDAQTKRKMIDMQMQEAQIQMEDMKRKREQEATIRAGMGQFFKPGQQALAPLMGDTSSGILPSAGRASVAPQFDASGAAQFLAQNGEYAQAIATMPKPKEAPINKLDVKDFTPQSVAKFAQTGNYGDLVRMDKAQFQNTGGATMALDPFTGKPLNVIQNTQSPDSKASNALGWANNSLSRQRFAFDQAGGAEAVKAAKPEWRDGQWVTAPRDMQPGETRAVSTSASARDANEALALIETAKKIIPKSTGSYLGAGVDQAARAFGMSTGGDTAAAQLKALEGALVSKMPKMSGPQSDKDVLLYKQMAGEIGDPTIPGDRKLAALKVIEEIQQRHTGAKPAAAKPLLNVPAGSLGSGTFKIISVE